MVRGAWHLLSVDNVHVECHIVKWHSVFSDVDVDVDVDADAVSSLQEDLIICLEATDKERMSGN